MKLLAGVLVLVSLTSSAFAARLSSDQVNHLKDQIMDWQTTNRSVDEYCGNIHKAHNAATMILYNTAADVNEFKNDKSKVESAELVSLKELKADFELKAEELEHIELNDCR